MVSNIPSHWYPALSLERDHMITLRQNRCPTNLMMKLKILLNCKMFNATIAQACRKCMEQATLNLVQQRIWFLTTQAIVCSEEKTSLLRLTQAKGFTLLPPFILIRLSTLREVFNLFFWKVYIALSCRKPDYFCLQNSPFAQGRWYISLSSRGEGEFCKQKN